MWAKEGLSNVLRRMGHEREADRLCEEVVERCFNSQDYAEGRSGDQGNDGDQVAPHRP